MTITTQIIDAATQTLRIDATGRVAERDCYIVEELARAAGMARFVVRLPHSDPSKPGGYVALAGSPGDMARSHRAAAIQQAADDADFWGGR